MRCGGKEHVEWDNPYDVGMTGLIGFSSGYYAMLDCDMLLMLGTDFPYRQFYPHGRDTHRAGRYPAGTDRPPRARSISASSATSARRSRHCCRCCKRNSDRRASRQAAHATIARRARDSMNWPPARRAGGRSIRSRSPRPISDQAAEDAMFTFDVGSADRLGCALSGDERQAAAARFVLARLDGQCDGAGDRRAGGVSRAGRSFRCRATAALPC